MQLRSVIITISLILFFQTGFAAAEEEIIQGRITEGEKVIKSRACHRIGEGGRVRFPDLTHVGSKIYPSWEVKWLKDPQAVKPGTYMPTFPLSSEEREAISAYLHTLK